MIDNIQNMWYSMLKETQAEALAALMVEFKLTSSTFIKQTWLQKGKIPEDSQAKVVEMFQRLLQQQIERTRAIINA